MYQDSFCLVFHIRHFRCTRSSLLYVWYHYEWERILRCTYSRRCTYFVYPCQEGIKERRQKNTDIRMMVWQNRQTSLKHLIKAGWHSQTGKERKKEREKERERERKKGMKDQIFLWLDLTSWETQFAHQRSTLTTTYVLHTILDCFSTSGYMALAISYVSDDRPWGAAVGRGRRRRWLPFRGCSCVVCVHCKSTVAKTIVKTKTMLQFAFFFLIFSSSYIFINEMPQFQGHGYRRRDRRTADQISWQHNFNLCFSSLSLSLFLCWLDSFKPQTQIGWL